LRAFLSYDLVEPTVVSNIAKFESELRSTGADIKLVDPGILHFTVRFLGEIDEAEKEKIVRALEGQVSSFDEQVLFKGIGTFPNERRISVIWIGCDSESGKSLTERVERVNSLIDSQLGQSNQPRQSFSPHLTIARVRSARNKDRLIEFLNVNRSREFGSANLGRLRLKLSELLPSGPRYSDLHVFE
jgi:RNA 2',3'-cyclic 3'-phosphodiesterase